MNLKDGWNRWEKPGDIATHPKLLNNGNKNAHKQSTRFLEDGSYARLRNVTLAYNLPAAILNKLNLTKFRILLEGDNLYTLTKFSGVDPETDANGNVGSRYPFAKKVLMGLQIGF